MKKKSISIPMLLTLVLSLLLSVGIAYLTTQPSAAYETLQEISEPSIIEQKRIATSSSPQTLRKMYYQDKLVGILNNPDAIYNQLQTVYDQDYKDEFPNSMLDLSDDIYFTDFQSNGIYENIDDKIFNFLDENELFSIQVTKITFSNGAIIFVKNYEDFESAKRKFLSNYIDDATYDKLNRNIDIPPIQSYGEQIISLNVKETHIRETGTTTIDNILVDENSILTFLSYGYEPEIETYTTVEFDTIEGIATQNGMTPLQLVTINRDKLVDINQIIVPGMELSVSKFNSPFTVTVERERMTEETIQAPATRYIEDNTLPKGRQIVEVVEQDGLRDSVYIDTYVNGTSISSELKSTKITLEPVQGVIRVGTYVPPSTGTGIFGRPMNNAFVLCHWGCYAGHRGTDFSAYGSGYGPIISIDNGVIVRNGYDARGWGYYTVIDHRNGYQSLYGHMVSPGYYSSGTVVSKGQQIGYVGMTGRTTYPHVHLEVYRNGTKINPCSVVRC